MATSTALTNRGVAGSGAFLLGVLLLTTLAASTSAAPAIPAAPVVPLTDTEAPRAALPRGRDFGRKDPFAVRSAALDATSGVRKSDAGFRLVATAGSIAVPGSTTDGSFVVVLRSVPVAAGRPVALRAAAEFRRRGLTNAGVLLSARYGSLRTGYYVVHAGRFSSRLAAWTTLLRARTAGADAPYVRPLKT
jgi:hypothetical protein